MVRLVSVLLVSFMMMACKPTIGYETIEVNAPFPMEPIKVCIFPEQDFVITEYGAVADQDNTEAIAKAIAACNAAGGGRVVVPAGTWITGFTFAKSTSNIVLARAGPSPCVTASIQGR